MPSNIPLQTTIDITRRYIYNSPLLFVNDGNLAFSIGDWVRQTILAPPFAWRWNRGILPPIQCSTGLTDYSVNVPDFGWLEKAWIVYPDPGPNPPPQSYPVGTVRELSVMNNLAQEGTQNQTAWISAVYDDNNGNLTFRMMPPPDYPVLLYINYQKSAKTFSKTSDLWTPIPDYMNYLYNQGFLAKAYEYKDDERFAFVNQQFLHELLSVNDGLSDAQRNIFLETRLLSQRQSQSVVQTGQIARQGRSS